MKKKNILLRIIEFFYHNSKSSLKRIETPEQYSKLFQGNQVGSDSILQKAYEKAWDARKFEIDNYWKRATYFWAFQAASFTGYFAILSSSSYNQIPKKNPETLYSIIS